MLPVKLNLSDFRKKTTFTELPTLEKVNDLVSEYNILYKYAEALENEIDGFDGYFDNGDFSVSLLPHPDKVKHVMFMQKAAKAGFELWKKECPDETVTSNMNNAFLGCVYGISEYVDLACVTSIINAAYKITKDNKEAMALLEKTVDNMNVADHIKERIKEYLDPGGQDPQNRPEI